MGRKPALVIALASLALLTGCQSLKQNERTITVSGSGQVTVVPDVVTFDVAVSETKESTSEAQASAAAKIATVLSVLRSSGIPDSDITTSGISIAPASHWEDGKQVPDGQNCTQWLEVKLRDLDALAGVLDGLGGIEAISVDNITFDKEDKSDAYATARRNASQAALDKAQAYAAPLGVQVGKAREVSDGTSYDVVLPRYKTAMAPAMAMEAVGMSAPSGTLEITANVSVVFDLL